MNRQLRYIAVVGSRDASYEDVLNAITSCKLSPEHHAIVSGGARGADAHAKKIAFEQGFHYVEVPANWDGPLKKAAGMARNSIIVDLADAIIAVWDGQSKGTGDTVGKAEKAGKKLQIFARLGERTDYEAGQAAAKR